MGVLWVFVLLGLFSGFFWLFLKKTTVCNGNLIQMWRGLKGNSADQTSKQHRILRMQILYWVD